MNKQDQKILNALRKKYKLTWNEFFHQLTTYSNLVEKALSLPPEVSQNAIINVQTAIGLMPLWLNSLRHNFETITQGKDILDIPKPKPNTPALIIGAGPSLTRKKHLDLLAEAIAKNKNKNNKFDCLLFASDRILKECLEHQIIPDYVLTLDGGENVYSFFNHDIVDKYSDKISAIMNVVTHPKVVQRWHGKKYFFINAISDDVLPNVSYIFHLLTNKTELGSAGHTSSLGWSVAYTLGCNPIALIGLDLSYPVDFPVEQSAYYDRLKEIYANDIDKVLSCYARYHHNYFNTDCYYDPVFKNFVDCSMSHFKKAAEEGRTVINCTEGGALEGEGLKCMYFKDFLQNL